MSRHSAPPGLVLFWSFVVAVLVFFICGLAMAGEASLSWKNPTLNTDGTTIPSACTTAPCGKLTSTRVEYGSCSGTAFGTAKGVITVPAPGAAAIVKDLVAQTFCFRAFAQNDYSVESATSNVAIKVIAPPTPAAPSGLTVGADLRAYKINIGNANKVTLAAIPGAVVPENTVCTNQMILGKYVIADRLKTVMPNGDKAPPQVLAACG